MVLDGGVKMLCKICCQNRSEPEVTCSTNGITAQKVNTAAENKRMYASVFTIISFIIEALIIFYHLLICLVYP